MSKVTFIVPVQQTAVSCHTNTKPLVYWFRQDKAITGLELINQTSQTSFYGDSDMFP